MPGSKVVTDMLSGYRKLGKYGFDHIQINHSVAFHDFRGNSNNHIEAYWSTVRRMLRSARQVSRSHMWTFLAEIEFKYNRRDAKEAIFDEMISEFPDIDGENIKILERKFDWSI
jgi:transposase-like protein